MTNAFKDFDFGLLDGPDFREDSVREELVVPLLRALGYSASPPYQIVRSHPLQHPFVYIGTIKKSITIIPDYILERDGKPAWILDAKAPNENIHSGKNVEQAYSYAMHKDVRVTHYALCNGRRLVVFHVSHEQPILDVPLADLQSSWLSILGLLGSRAAWTDGRHPYFLPDFGLALRKAGLAEEAGGRKIHQLFMSAPIYSVGRVQDGVYCINSIYGFENEPPYMLTLDFGAEKYGEFLAALPPDARELVRSHLSRQPYKVYLATHNAAEPEVTIAATAGDKVYTNDNESYCPFIAESFLS